MRTKLLLLLLVSFVVTGAKSQDNQEIVDYYNLKIDELVDKCQTISDDYDEEKTNPVYAKVFTTPVLYNSVIEKAFDTETESENDELLAMDDKRADVIDGLMLDFYKNAPEHVEMTENELRSEKSVLAYKSEIEGLNIDINNSFKPEDVVGGMKTTVVKPNYWKFGGRTSLTFTQNFLSPNWFQGGESNYAMLATIDLDLNYDNQDRISWTNHFDFDLGFATYPSDEYHKFKTNSDKLLLESTFGYKLVKNLDLAAKVKGETQTLPNYPSNSPTFISNFAAPLDVNASIGLNYKPTFGDFKMEVYLAPISSYNLRYVCYEDLAYTFGLPVDDNGNQKLFRHDFGTQLVVTIPTYKITSFLDVYSRLEYYISGYTDKEPGIRNFFQWETKFNVALSKYFTASLMLHTRFDDSVNLDALTDEAREWRHWQLKELFTLGVAYAW
ncbi:MAG: DUF3078 domain-containing protein [Bacteroidaceae bacterium]|nr:DUF3078 domain-containing protein [Bacteroidaceae bacterium]